jgi:hypothetical protein
MTDVPHDCPTGLRQALTVRRATPTETWRENARVYLRAKTPEGEVFARYSSDPAEERTLRHELLVREIVGTSGKLRAPAVLEHGRSWCIEQAVASGPCRGSAAVDAITAAATAIPRLRLPEGPAPRSRSRSATLRSTARVARSPMPVRHLLAARRILGNPGLPLVSAHGDFQTHNLLFAEGVLWVVDWELCGRLPAGLDLMQAWATLEDEQDRERLFDAALDQLGQHRRCDLERLRYAIVVRTIANMLAGPAEFDRNPEGAKRLLEMLPDLVRRDDR